MATITARCGCSRRPRWSASTASRGCRRATLRSETVPPWHGKLEKQVKKDRTVFVPLVDGLGARCEGFKLKAKGTELVRLEQEKSKSKRPETWQVRLGEGRLTLSGPCRGGGLCSLPYLVVALKPDRLVLLPARDDLASRVANLLAYHQDDAELWFFDRAACESGGGIDHASSLLPLP
ncbi:MAG: hypothetical protein QM765_07625 [Myxococcales bacterium]